MILRICEIDFQLNEQHQWEVHDLNGQLKEQADAIIQRLDNLDYQYYERNMNVYSMMTTKWSNYPGYLAIVAAHALNGKVTPEVTVPQNYEGDYIISAETTGETT